MVLNGSWQGLGARHSRTLLRQEYLRSNSPLSFQQWLLTTVREHTAFIGTGPYCKSAAWQPNPPPPPVLPQAKVAAKSMPSVAKCAAGPVVHAPKTPPVLPQAKVAAKSTPSVAKCAAGPVLHAPKTPPLPPQAKVAAKSVPSVAECAAGLMLHPPKTPPPAASPSKMLPSSHPATLRNETGVLMVEVSGNMARVTFTSKALAQLFLTESPPDLGADRFEQPDDESSVVYIQWKSDAMLYTAGSLTDFLIQWVNDDL
jgi:hypothetical protein